MSAPSVPVSVPTRQKPCRSPWASAPPDADDELSALAPGTSAAVASPTFSAAADGAALTEPPTVATALSNHGCVSQLSASQQMSDADTRSSKLATGIPMSPPSQSSGVTVPPRENILSSTSAAACHVVDCSSTRQPSQSYNQPAAEWIYMSDANVYVSLRDSSMTRILPEGESFLEIF